MSSIIDPTSPRSPLSREILEALTMLTLESQLRGSYNTLLGQGATKLVFDLIKEIVAPGIQYEDSTSIIIQNAAGRNVRIEFAPDPDIAIREELSFGKLNNRIAIEIKGGRDVSNIPGFNSLVQQTDQRIPQKVTRIQGIFWDGDSIAS